MRWLASFVITSACAMAAPAAPPAWQKELTPFTTPSHPRLDPCKLDYRASWKGLIDAGAIHMEFGNPADAKAGSYVAKTNGTSLGAAAALYDFKSWYWSEMDPATFRPKLFHTVEDVDKRRVTYHLDYGAKETAWSRRTKNMSTGFEYENKGIFAFAPVHDLFSAMLFVRGRKLDNGDTVTFVIQPGDSAYVVNAHVDGRENHRDRATIRMSVTMHKIDPGTLELRPYTKLKSASLWLSDDADRIPVEIRAAVFIGDVRVVLAGKDGF